MIKNLDLFEKERIPKAVTRLIIPTVLSMLVSVLYNMVDTFFVGQLGDKSKVAAVSVATPVFLFFMALGNVFGVGGSSFISRALGQKKYETPKKVSSFCFYAGIISGVAGGILMLMFMTPILNSIGNSEGTLGYAEDYLTVIAYGGPLIVVSTAFSNIVRGEGSAKSSMVGMMAGTITNIVLDPVFILPSFLGMGVTGAAVATLIGNLVSTVIYVWHILTKSSVLSLNIKDFCLRDGVFTGVLSIGFPASITNVLMSLSNIVMNKQLVIYGDENVAAMGIAMKANILAVFIHFGIAMGVQPLIGYNYGARNFKRMKSAMRFALLVDVISGFLVTLMYFIFTTEIVTAFMPDNPEVIEPGVMMLRALMIASPVMGILFIFNFTFQAMGKAIPSLMLAVSRQGFVFLPLVFILGKYFGLKGLVHSQPIADYVSILMALIMFLVMNVNIRKMTRESQEKNEVQQAL